MTVIKRFKKILFATHGIADDQIAFKRCMSLAQHNQASLTVIQVFESEFMPLGMAGYSAQALREAAVKERLEQMKKEITGPLQKMGLEAHAEVLWGMPFLEIVREVLRHDYDLVIKAAEPNTLLTDLLLGNTDLKLLRKCPCPVWIMKHLGEQESYKRILVAVNPDPREPNRVALNACLLDLSSSLALSEDCEMHIVFAWHPYSQGFFYMHQSSVQEEVEASELLQAEIAERRGWLDQLLEEYGKRCGEDTLAYLNPQVHLIEEDPRKAIPQAVSELGADLVVMGTVSRIGIPGLIMGNTAESILRQINSSVLVAKPPGFQTPVTLS